jgi:hypothetical protein
VEGMLLDMPCLGVQHFVKWLASPEMRYIIGGLTKLLEAYDEGEDIKDVVDTKFDDLD